MLNASNVIMLTGNLGKKPETKNFDNGNSVTEFSLATSDSYKDKSGERVTRTEWHNVKAFGKTGEILAKYCDKGSKLQVVGTMRYRKWVDKHEQNRTNAEIIVESFNFLGGNDSGGGGSQPKAAAKYGSKPEPVAAESSDDELLPF